MIQNDINISLPVNVPNGGTGVSSIVNPDGIIYCDGSSTGPLQSLPISAPNTILASSGTALPPIWNNPIILLQTQTFSAVTSVDFTTGFNILYSSYVVYVSNAMLSGGSTSMFMYVSSDGGFSFYNVNYRGGSSNLVVTTNGNSWGVSANSTGSMRVTTVNSLKPSNSETFLYGFAPLQNPINQSFFSYSTNAVTNMGLSTSTNINTAMNAIRFAVTAGTFSGTISLYGVI